MKIVSFNSNSIRTRLHQLEALIKNHDPDIIGLQETKVCDEEFPIDAIAALGYESVFHGQKTHYGVALLSKQTPLFIQKGFPGDDENAQRRFISATYPLSKKSQDKSETITIINGYFPQGESRDHEIKFPAKEKFYRDLLDYLQENHKPTEHLMVMGDMNISPEDIDIGIGEENRKRWLKTGKCSFLPEEREWLNAVLQWGLFDTFRQNNPKKELFSWFDYRSKGFEKKPPRGLRIDLIIATQALLKKCQATGIDYDIRSMERPSDHCPIWVELEL